MAVGAYLPTLGAVVTTALIDSINPCAIGVLILLMSIMIAFKSKKEMLYYGIMYVLAVYVTYIIAGFGILFFLSSVPLYISEYISIIVGGLIIIAGLIEIKDFFWYGQGITLAIPAKRAKQIHDMTKKITLPGVLFLGAFVAGVELPCTGAPYLAILLLLSQNFDFTAFLMLVLYNFIFVLPLLVILLMVHFGFKLQNLKRWKQNNRTYMRLATGVVLIFLGWLLVLIANGSITFN
ncbi:MAG TPA: GAP family protein [Candidatus Nanoarchaeia archaeon]|nr:GAP family protein [Candidatus Nanoarchaeia archaeon]